MTNNMMLTASQIRYLLTLKRLDTGDGIRSVDVAKELKLSKPSVHNMMNYFIEKKFICKESRGQVYLTECGLKMAYEIEAFHVILKERLFSGKELDHTADLAICAFLAELSWDALKALV